MKKVTERGNQGKKHNPIVACLLSENQMSEAFINSAFLALSGGFQDAYTYNTRNEVFSNAQTGNVVLMSQHFMAGEWMDGLRYLLPAPFVCAWRVLSGENTEPFPVRKKNALETGDSSCGDRDLIFGRIYAGGTQYDSNHTGIFCLRDAGADVSQGQRLFLREHDVHRKSEERNGGAVSIYA